MKQFTYIGVIVTILMAVAGCSRKPMSPPTTAATLPGLSKLPVEITVEQRSTSDVPGSDGLLLLTIEDITRGQVIASLRDKDGSAVLAPTSLKSGDSATFRWGAGTYQLQLEELSNALVGEDFARFVIAEKADESTNDAQPSDTTESAKIEALLSLIEASRGDVFIRNGVENSAKDAADHLRDKWKTAGSRITTVQKFIDEIATTSSISGEPYRVRRSDGTELPASDYLRDRLTQLESGQRP